MKVVIDVNVWVSGLLWGGIPAQILQLAQRGTIVSQVLIREILICWCCIRLGQSKS
jgi:uncharacterized protein